MEKQEERMGNETRYGKENERNQEKAFFAHFAAIPTSTLLVWFWNAKIQTRLKGSSMFSMEVELQAKGLAHNSPVHQALGRDGLGNGAARNSAGWRPASLPRKDFMKQGVWYYFPFKDIINYSRDHRKRETAQISDSLILNSEVAKSQRNTLWNLRAFAPLLFKSRSWNSPHYYIFDWRLVWERSGRISGCLSGKWGGLSVRNFSIVS